MSPDGNLFLRFNQPFGLLAGTAVDARCEVGWFLGVALWKEDSPFS